VLELRGVSKSWAGREVLSPFSYKVTKGERIGVVGPNGSGKSTLLDLISGRTGSDSGEIDRGETVAIGYFDQNATDMDAGLTIIDYVRKAAERVRLNDETELTAEQFLERFAFPRPMQAQILGKLSGGELRRLLLVRLLIASPNVLLLDEPTNDFDIPTIALLEDFLSSFSGCVIAVSHDRAFLEGIADSLWVLDGAGGVESFVGSYASWRETRAAAEEAAAIAAAEHAAKRAAAEKRQGADGAAALEVSAKLGGKLSFKENKELEGLLGEIDALETERSALESRFADPSAELAKDGAAYAAATSRYAELEALITKKTLRWEELAARSEA
jgi:ATP-binding cassette subfamily F protein uup